MEDPICFKCKHFRQYQPLEFTKPGECGWQPDAVPAWLELYINSEDYYAPKRDVWSRKGTTHTVRECQTFSPVPDTPRSPRRGRENGES